MRDSILAFYHGGPEWPPAEAANKSAREKKPDRDSICRECRTIIPPGENVCPGCGKARPVRTYGGSGSKLERVNGDLRLIDSVTGQASAYGGDLWPEVCAEALRLAKGDAERAKKRAFASYRAITGKWPPTRRFKPVDRSTLGARPGGCRPDAAQLPGLAHQPACGRIMRFGSVCSGIEAASVAWHPLGWECAWVSEIDPHACSVLSARFPTRRISAT